ncbi:hypothetical protein ACNHYB_01645 [Isoptericola jiangsuensis]|uniref:hypothetical protein n=1 Tax=Isoptericola jiangsuensis TaxID=548579 RepID=UPI003AB10542
MLVLLVTPVDDDGPSLAAAWGGAAPRCVVETLACPAPAPSSGAPSAGPSSEPSSDQSSDQSSEADGPPALPAADVRPGVFVPTTALGLRSVGAPTPPAHVALLHERAAAADVVVVHTRVLDAAALHDGPVAEAARAAAPHGVPVVVLAGADRTSRRELAAAGVSGTHVVGDPWEAGLVARAARTWVPSWSHGT